jgi:hypothetical protein
MGPNKLDQFFLDFRLPLWREYDALAVFKIDMVIGDTVVGFELREL